jgi:hypothetical protein
MHRLIHALRCDEKGAALVEYGGICVAIPTRPTYVPRGSAASRAPVGTISVGTSFST